MMTNPCPHCRRLSCKAGLTLVMLGLTLALCALLIGCASPCKPSITPSSADRMTPTLISRLLDSEIGINCEWRY